MRLFRVTEVSVYVDAAASGRGVGIVGALPLLQQAVEIDPEYGAEWAFARSRQLMTQTLYSTPPVRKTTLDVLFYGSPTSRR